MASVQEPARMQFDLFDGGRAVAYREEETPEEERCSWTDHDIEMLRDGMLQCLSWLGDERASAEEKQQWLAWVRAPFKALEDPDVTRDPRIPFSFQVCCVAAGVDPEGMRELVLGWLGPERSRSVVHAPQLSWFSDEENDT